MSRPQNRTEADDLGLLVQTAWRRSPLMLLVGVLCGVLAYVAASLTAPSYEAQATLLIDPRSSTALREQEFLSLPDDGTSRAWAVRAEAAVASSLDVARKAVEGLPVADRAMIVTGPDRKGLGDLLPFDAASEPPTDAQILRAFRRAVSVYHDPNTFILRVRATAPDADLAAAMANGLVEAYLELGTRERRDEVKKILAATDTELGLVFERVDDAETQITGLDASETGGLDPEVVKSRLSTLYDRIEQTRAELLDRQLDLETASSTDPLNLGVDLPVLQSERERLFALSEKIETRERLGAQNQSLTELTFERSRIETALREAASGIVDQKRRNVATVSERLDDLEARAAALERGLLDGLVTQARLRELRTRLDGFGARRTELIARRLQIEALESTVASDVVVVEPAVAPVLPLWPRPKLVAAVGATLGAMLVLGLGLWSARRRVDAQARPGATAPESATEARELAKRPKLIRETET